MTSGLPWGLALSSGVNTYLPLFLLALFARFGHVVHLSPRFQWLISDQAIFVLGILAVSEVLAQKFPVLDNLWDFVHTLLRPIAGALAAGATLTTDSAFQIVLAMLMGGTLATAAHSTKSSLRLASTTKTFGIANFVLSLGEDAAVLSGTLLAVYAPWVMLGLVLLFVLIFALIGPRIIRTLCFDLSILGAGFTSLVRWVFRLPRPASLKESLLEMTPERLQELGAGLEAGEELYGALRGWKRARGGPRRTWLLLTSRRLLWLQPRLFRAPKIQAMTFPDIRAARFRNLIVFAKLEVLSRQNESVTLNLNKRYAEFGDMAARRIHELAGLAGEPAPEDLQASSRHASAPR
jgi:hypothetical protein